MKNILVVDDDRTNLISAQNSLEGLYKTVAVSDGTQALKYLESNTCDLILLDINMPEPDGFEIMRRIRENGDSAMIPVIFLSDDGGADTETRCFEAGAADFVVKPFAPEVLRARAGRVLEFEDMRRGLLGGSQNTDTDKELVDLKHVHEAMAMTDSGRGAYQLDLESFHHVYNFIHRFVERSGRDVQTVLFTMDFSDDMNQSEADEAIEALEKAIYTSLRRTDVSTKYSGRQLIVILMETSTGNGDLVAKRIIDCFENIYTGKSVRISYNIAKIESGASYGLHSQFDGQIRSILVVDDDKTNLIAAKSVLGDLYKVIAVPAGAQALKFLENNTCDLVLLDINMPEMDGFEVLKGIRASHSEMQIPVIFLTAENDPDTENKCLEAGALDYIIKPFSAKVLRSRIGRTLELEDLKRNLEQKVNDKTERISYIQDMTVLGMATMVESRDNSTGGHIMRTGDSVKVFTKYLYKTGYISSADYLKKIVRAAPMHDLGKISIDDRILRKNGKFDDDEYREMKRHSAEGARIVEKMLRGVDEDDFVDIAVNVARYHHERWDGRGYPEGKTGEDIPAEARIMALADVFDALVSPRCYKPAFSYDKAFSIIDESLGTQFDPELGRYFLECREELERLYDSYNLYEQQAGQ